MKQAIVTVKPEQKRTDEARATRVTKSANDAIGRADLLYLDCCGALTRSVGSIETFRDNAVKIAAGFLNHWVAI